MYVVLAAMTNMRQMQLLIYSHHLLIKTQLNTCRPKSIGNSSGMFFFWEEGIYHIGLMQKHKGKSVKK